MRLTSTSVVLQSAGLFCVLQFATPLLHAQVGIPVGTKVPVAATAEFSSKTAKKGDAIPLVVSEDVVIDGHVVIPKGLPVKGSVSNAKKAGRGGKAGRIEISVDSLQLPTGEKIGLYADLDDTISARIPDKSNASANVSGLPNIPGAGFLRKGDDVTFPANQLIPVFTISYAAVQAPSDGTPATPTTAPTTDSAGAATAIAPAAMGLFDATHIWARAIATLAAHLSDTPDVRNAGEQIIRDDSALQAKGVALAAQSHTVVPPLDAATQTKLNGLLKALQETPSDKFDVTVMQQLYEVQSGFVGNIDAEDDSPMGKLLLEAAPVWKSQMETVAKIITK